MKSSRQIVRRRYQGDVAAGALLATQNEAQHNDLRESLDGVTQPEEETSVSM